MSEEVTTKLSNLVFLFNKFIEANHNGLDR